MCKNKYIFCVAIIIMFANLTGCSLNNNNSPVVQSVQETEYALDTGDIIRLIVFGHETLSGDFSIGAGGKISFPLILETQVSGLTIQELEVYITEALSPQYLLDPKISIEVLSYRDVYILGEVRTPGKYPYIPNMTVQQAVAIAGGYTYRAKEDSAEITRQYQGEITTEILSAKSTILPGDTLVVTRRWF